MALWGIRGATTATVFGQIVAMVLAAILNHAKNKDVSALRCHPTRTISIIYQVGVPSIPTRKMQSISSVLTFGAEQILISFSKQP